MNNKLNISALIIIMIISVTFLGCNRKYGNIHLTFINNNYTIRYMIHGVFRKQRVGVVYSVISNDTCFSCSKGKFYEDFSIEEFKKKYFPDLKNTFELMKFADKYKNKLLFKKTCKDLQEYKDFKDKIYSCKLNPKDSFLFGYEIFIVKKYVRDGYRDIYVNHNYNQTREEYIHGGYSNPFDIRFRRKLYKLVSLSVEELKKFPLEKFEFQCDTLTSKECCR